MSRIITLAARMRGSFLSDVMKLSFGTLGGRMIALAALPLVTRLYTPKDFALLAVYLALVGPLAVASCLRLDVAIPLAETEGEATDLLAIALAVLALVTTLLTLPALLVPDRVAAVLGAPTLAPYLWLVPLGVAMAGGYSILQLWSTRARRFGAIARTRIGQSAAGVSVTLALGWAGITPLGLLLGNMLNISAGGISLAASALAHDRAVLRAIRLRNLLSVFRRNWRYPLFSTPEALFNVAGVQLPILLIAAHAGSEAGFLLLAMQVMTTPMALLGSSISQVYVSRAPAKYREGQLAPFTLDIMRRLALLGVGPLIIAGALAPLVFPWLFGSQWARAGEIAQWLVPWTALQFIASPVSMVMYVVGWQIQSLWITLASTTGRLTAVLLALNFNLPPTEAFVLASAFSGIVLLIVSVIAARRRPSVTEDDSGTDTLHNDI